PLGRELSARAPRRAWPIPARGGSFLAAGPVVATGLPPPRRTKMPITSWDPFTEMRSLARRLERFMEPLTSAAPTAFREPMRYFGEGFWPNVDVYEDKEEIVCWAELPGMDIKDVEIRLEDSTLTIQGERKLMREDKKE